MKKILLVVGSFAAGMLFVVIASQIVAPYLHPHPYRHPHLGPQAATPEQDEWIARCESAYRSLIEIRGPYEAVAREYAGEDARRCLVRAGVNPDLYMIWYWHMNER